MTQALGAGSQRTAREAALPQRGQYNALLMHDRDSASPLVRQFVGYGEVRELQLSV
jgi:hypothetical protein